MAISEISNISQKIELEFDIQAITVFANNKEDTPRNYELLLEGVHPQDKLEKISDKFENMLLDNFHYRLARDLGQLEKASVTGMENCIEYYNQKMSCRIKVAGDVKLEQVVVLN